jgi:hypothetical protein
LYPPHATKFVLGDRVESLKAEDDPHKLQTALLGWLKRTVAKLEEEVAGSK